MRETVRRTHGLNQILKKVKFIETEGDRDGNYK